MATKNIETFDYVHFIFEYSEVITNTTYEIQDSRVNVYNGSSKSRYVKATKREITWGTPDNGVDKISSNSSTVSITLPAKTTNAWYQKDGDRWGVRKYNRTTSAYTEKIGFNTNCQIGSSSDSTFGYGILDSPFLIITVPALPKFTINYYTDSSLKTLWTTRSQFINAHGVTRKVSAVSAPTKTGYNFKTWHCSETGAEVSDGTYNSGTPTTYHAYAVWTAQTSTVTLDKRSGTGGSASVTATYDSAMPSITVPTRTGYTFLGYYDAASGGTPYYTSSGTSARIWNKTGNQTLYAHWSAISYTVTLDRNGGSGGSASVTATYDSAMPSITVPTRTGYVFQGYYNTSATSGGTQYYTSSGTSTRAWDTAKSTTLYARWLPYQLTINYYANGATYDSQSGTRVAISNQLLSTDITNYDGTNYKTYGLPNANGGTWILSKDGYHATEFWHVGSSSGSTINANIPYNTNQALATALGDNLGTGNVTKNLYADLVINTYTINYNGNGADGGSTASSTHNYNQTVSFTTNSFYKVGFVFSKWNTKADGTGIDYIVGNNYTNIYSDITTVHGGSITLYAIWIPNPEPYKPTGDYQYSILNEQNVQVTVKDQSKSTYADIPATFTLTEHGVTKTFTVSSLDNCFYDCDNLSGEIFVSSSPTSYNNIFGNTSNNIYILSTNADINHNTWKTIANLYDKVTYDGADGQYSYTVITRSENSHTYSAKVLDNTQVAYNNPCSTFTAVNSWTLTSLNGCYQNCTKLISAPDVSNTVTDMTDCYNTCQFLQNGPSSIPSSVTLMDRCFSNCESLTGNIIVENNPSSYANIFYNQNTIKKDIYIINNGGDSTTWISIAGDINYDNVHYEINDLDVSNATFTVTRQYYTSDININPTPTFGNPAEECLGGYLNTHFELLKEDILYLPVGWTITEALVRVKMGESIIFEIEHQPFGENKIIIDRIVHFPRNNQEIKLSATYTILYGNNSFKTVLREYTFDGLVSNNRIIDIDHVDDDYIYKIIVDDDINDIHKVAAYVINKKQNSYNNLSTITLNNKTYTVTSFHYPLYESDGTHNNNLDYLGWCYENCINLETAPQLPTDVTDYTNCFKGCTKLQGNVNVDINPTAFDDMFTGANVNQPKDLYIVNMGHAYPRLWRQIVESYQINNTRTHIHYEGDDNDVPNVISAEVTRGIYDTETQEWTSSDTESWIRMILKTNLLTTYLPDDKVNNYIKEISLFFRDEYFYDNDLDQGLSVNQVYYTKKDSIIYTRIINPVYNSTFKYYSKTNDDTYVLIDDNSLDNYTTIAYALSNDTTVVGGIQYYRKENNQYVRVYPTIPGYNPKTSGLYEQYRYFNNNAEVYVRAYSKQEIVLYFKDSGVTQATAQISVSDFYAKGKEGTYAQQVYQVFAMLDFIPGARGMAIGKIGTRNGLDIGLPTTIGMGLLPSSNFTPSTDTSNEKTYYILEDNEYVQTNNPQYRQATEYNEEEIYYEYNNGEYEQVVPDISLITNYYVGWYEKTDDIDLRKIQLIIGKYNIPISNAAFIVGNGTDENNRSNSLVVNWDGTVEGIDATKVSIVRW